MVKTTIKYVPEFTVVGKLGQGKSEEGPQWILPLWDQANAQYGMIKDIAVKGEGGAPKSMWGIMGHPDKFLGRWDNVGLYLAGCEIEADSEAPEGWTKWTVPAQTYLVADVTQTAYGEVFGEVIEEYMPKHGLHMVGAAHEHYPEPGNPQRVELYFPITENYLFCQSCGMPLTENEHLGTEKDGEVSYNYCTYCYQDGSFTDNHTMEEMIDVCLKLGGDSGMFENKDEARKTMLEWFPTLKRWKSGN